MDDEITISLQPEEVGFILDVINLYRDTGPHPGQELYDEDGMISDVLFGKMELHFNKFIKEHDKESEE